MPKPGIPEFALKAFQGVSRLLPDVRLEIPSCTFVWLKKLLVSVPSGLAIAEVVLIQTSQEYAEYPLTLNDRIPSSTRLLDPDKSGYVASQQTVDKLQFSSISRPSNRVLFSSYLLLATEIYAWRDPHLWP